jgi:hypothetical protein
MGADLGTVLGLKGDAFGVFFLRAELGQIRGLFWGSKGVHLGFFIRAELGQIRGLFGAQRGLHLRFFFKGRFGDCFGAQRGCIWVFL